MKRILMLVVLLLMGISILGAAARITVGSKNFDEQLIIGEMMAQLLEDRGYDVERAFDLSSDVLRAALEAGDIDVCAEYTGTAWMNHFGYESSAALSNDPLYFAVKTVDATDYGITWLDPIWNNNTYVFVSWAEFAEENDLDTLTDLTALYNEKNGRIPTFVTVEFSGRPDGLPALEEFYGFEIDQRNLRTGLFGVVISALQNRDTTIALAFGTTAQIGLNDWHIYRDDQGFFPLYDLVPNVRTEVLEKHPEIADILNELVATFPGGGSPFTPDAGAACRAVWQHLNERFYSVGQFADVVAREYLVSHGLISE